MAAPGVPVLPGVDLDDVATHRIRPPRLRPGLLPRPALESRLARAFGEARLVLLAAPAGSGKTALLTRCIATLPAGTALAWVSLDEDDTLRRVARALLAALEPFDLPWRAAPEALLQSADDGERDVVVAFVAALSRALAGADVPLGVLVFDDLHRVGDPSVHRLLDLLVDQLPPPWTVVIATREAPALSLPRLRAAQAVLELPAAELGFSSAEVQALVARQVDDPSAGAALAGALHARTGGWAAGVALLLGSGWRVGATGGSRGAPQHDRHAFEFIASEMLHRLPAPQREFLLACSVLEQLTDEACRAITGDAAASQRLDELERSAAFVVVLDAETRTLRLPELFRDALDDQLRREAPARRLELLQRAASIETDPMRRVGLLQRAGRVDEAEALVASLAQPLLTDGALAELQRLVDQFPAARRDTSAPLQLARTLAAWARWDWATMRDASARAAESFAARGDLPGWRRARSYGAVALAGLDQDTAAQTEVDALLGEPVDDEIRARALLVAGWVALAHGRHADLARAWTGTVDALERIDRLPMWYECSPLPSYIGLPGLQAPLRRYVAGAWRRLPERPVPLSGMLQVTLGWLQLLEADWDGLGESLANAEAEDRWLGRPTNLHLQRLMLLAMGCALRGDARGTRQAADTTLAFVDAMTSPAQRASYQARLHYYAARVSGIAGDLDTLREHRARLEQQRLHPAWPLADGYREHLLAMAAQADGDTSAACDAWHRALASPARIDVFGNAIEVRLRLAAASARLGRDPDARAQFAPSYERLRDGGGPGTALMAGPQALQTLLQHAVDRQWPEDWIAALRRWHELARAARPAPPPPPPPPAPAVGAGDASLPAAASPAIGPGRAAAEALQARAKAAVPFERGAAPEPPHGAAVIALPQPVVVAGLSPREVEVLERIAAGDSNKLIARAFDLSPHTVKRHVANILDKLGVASRGQAAAWWRGRQQPSMHGAAGPA